MPMPSPFDADGFTMESLTAAINNMDHVPGRAGELVFTADGVFQPVATTAVDIEFLEESDTLIATSIREAPAEKLDPPAKRKLVQLDIPHIKLEDTIQADSVQNVRAFGTENELLGPEMVVNQQLQKMVRRHDYTLEHLRLGALCGVVKDADGSDIADMFAEFAILNSIGNPEPEVFEHFLDGASVTADDAVRIKCQNVWRTVKRNAKMELPPDAQLWAFCGDDFFDALISHPSVKEVWDGFGAAQETIERRGGNYAYGVFEIGGIMFENYRGSDDNDTISIRDDEARLFLTGVPGLYAEHFAPADFLDTVNKPGEKRYARLAPDRKFNRFVEIHTQQNPLPLCLRPRTLMRAVIGADS